MNTPGTDGTEGPNAIDLDKIQGLFLAAANEFGDERFDLNMSVTDAICVVSMLQLAWRHPRAKGPSATIAENFARTLQACLGKGFCPELAEGLELGWNTILDVPGGGHPDWKCRVCGCTEAKACTGGCHWVSENLCSACEPTVRSLITP